MSNISQINKPKISIQEQIARLEDKGVTFALYSKYNPRRDQKLRFNGERG